MDPASVKSAQYAKIVIVGAGPSGIAAAKRLYENGITDILILEAEDRIGGRIYTKAFKDATTVELGAEYCHGEKGNIVFELANKYGLLEKIESRYNYYHSSGELVDQSFLNTLHGQLNDIYDSAEDASDKNISIGQYVMKRFNEDVVTEHKKDEKTLKLMKDFYEYFVTSMVSLDGAFSLFDVSARTCYKECEGDQQLVWKRRGYKTILDILLKRFPTPDEEVPILSKIIFNKEVSDIFWSDLSNYVDRNVIVKCSDGTIYTAHHLIFTPSLGVLKHNHIKLFHPHLPKDKVEAIENLGIAAVSKIFLHFPDKWWPEDDITTFLLIWSDEDKEKLAKEFPFGPIRNGKSWLTNIVDFISRPNSSVLIAWACGEFVPEIEQLSDNVVMDGITHILRKFLCHKYQDICKPDAILRNNWYTNPHFRGTYTFETLASAKQGISLQDVLAKPLISNKEKVAVLFAGEATHPKYYSTVHGAIETGFREAQRIIDLTN